MFNSANLIDAEISHIYRIDTLWQNLQNRNLGNLAIAERMGGMLGS
jgi:hypothetical protein